MILLKTATTPLDFAYLATKRMYCGTEQVTCLREIAAVFGGNTPSPVDISKSLSLLSEVRFIMHHDPDGLSFQYPFLARDYDHLQRHDLALEVIDDCVTHAKNKSALDRTILITNAAKACLDISEIELCRSILPEMNRLQYAARLLEWDSGPFPLLLRLGRVSDAVSVAKSMDTRCRACAFTEIAFHGWISDARRVAILDYALNLAERSHYVTDDVDIFDWSRAYIVNRLTGDGQFKKALDLTRKIRNQDCCSHSLILIAIRMLENGMADKATKVIETIREIRKRYRIDCREYVHNPLSSHFRLKLIPDEELLSLVIPLTEAGLENIARSILEDALAYVERIHDYTTRLESLAELIRWFATIDINFAETLLDRVVSAPLAGLELREDYPSITYSRTAPSILFRLSFDIFKNELSWSKNRQEQLRQHLEPLPINHTI